VSDKKLHSEALERFDLATNDPDDQRMLALDDRLFVHAEDGQWEDSIKAKRSDRPRYTVDRISPAIAQIVGDQRQNRMGIKVVPRHGGTEKIAKILTGLIRAIDQEPEAINAKDNAFLEGLEGGYGGWRVTTELIDEMSFDDEQDIKIEAIFSAESSMFPDPNARRYDKSDGQFWYIVERMTTKGFKAKWPKAQVLGMDTPKPEAQSMASWFNEETVRVAEYWFKEPVKKEIGLLSDGRVIDLGEEEAVLDELAAQGITIEKRKTINSHIVKSVIMSGAEFLTPITEWAGKFIPIIPFYGKEATVGSHHFMRGMVRPAKDSQRIYNYATSAAVEATALTPKDPYFATPKQVAKHKQQWRTFNTKNPPVMLYDPDPDAPGPPTRGGAPQVQTALLQQIDQSARDIHATTGLEPASLGNVPELKSGKAIEAQQRMGDRGSFEYTGNLKKSISFAAEVYVDLIPRIYDTERVVQILGDDGTTEDVLINQATDQINQPIIDEQTGKPVIVNDLSQGKYSVKVTTGPAYATQRQETVAQLTSLAGQSETLAALAMDIIVKNLDINEGEELVSRIRAGMIKQGTIQPTEEEIKELGLDQPTEEDPTNVAIQQNLDAQTEKLQIEVEKIISEARNIDADTQKKFLEAQKITVDSMTKAMEAVIKKLEAGAVVTTQDIDVVEGQKAIVEETQQNVLEQNEFAETPPIGGQNTNQLQTPTGGQPGQNPL
jgi:hypothetical protein